MKDILTAPFVKEMCDTTANMYRLGWDERNGGNISYMLDENEVAQYIDINNVIRNTNRFHGRCTYWQNIYCNRYRQVF
mgnify:CR=1 FL=1